MAKTSNYQLNIPPGTAYYSVEEFNENATIIDTELSRLNNNINSVSDNINNKIRKLKKELIGMENNYTDTFNLHIKNLMNAEDIVSIFNLISFLYYGISNDDNIGDINLATIKNRLETLDESKAPKANPSFTGEMTVSTTGTNGGIVTINSGNINISGDITASSGSVTCDFLTTDIITLNGKSISANSNAICIRNIDSATITTGELTVTNDDHDAEIIADEITVTENLNITGGATIDDVGASGLSLVNKQYVDDKVDTINQSVNGKISASSFSVASNLEGDGVNLRYNYNDIFPIIGKSGIDVYINGDGMVAISSRTMSVDENDDIHLESNFIKSEQATFDYAHVKYIDRNDVTSAVNKGYVDDSISDMLDSINESDNSFTGDVFCNKLTVKELSLTKGGNLDGIEINGSLETHSLSAKYLNADYGGTFTIYGNAYMDSSLITDNPKSLVNKEYVDNSSVKYETTPVKIGTWVDGTPIWRVSVPFIKITNTIDKLLYHDNQDISICMDYLKQCYFLNNSILLNANIIGYDEEPVYPIFPIMDGNYAKFSNYYSNFVISDTGYWGGYIDVIGTQDNVKTSPIKLTKN